jgi:hypothetical protein
MQKTKAFPFFDISFQTNVSGTDFLLGHVTVSI